MASPPYPLHPEPLKRGWLELHPLWKIPLGCLILILLIVVFGGVVMTIVTASFRGSDVYKQALAKATENNDVRARLGEPIRPAWLVSGQLNVSGSTGKANSLPPSSSRRRRRPNLSCRMPSPISIRRRSSAPPRLTWRPRCRLPQSSSRSRRGGVRRCASEPLRAEPKFRPAVRQRAHRRRSQ